MLDYPGLGQNGNEADSFRSIQVDMILPASLVQQVSQPSKGGSENSTIICVFLSLREV